MDYAESLRMFKVKYLGPTDYKGARVSIRDLRFGTLRIIPYDHHFNASYDQAKAWLEAKGISVDYQAENLNDGVLLGTTNFDTDI